MKFQPGDIRINRKGRPKGKPNLTTDQLRGVFALFLEDNIDDLQAQYDSLEALQKLTFIEKIARLVLPAPLNDIDRLPDDQFEALVTRLRQTRQ